MAHIRQAMVTGRVRWTPRTPVTLFLATARDHIRAYQRRF